jgi:hypothetical protein
MDRRSRTFEASSRAVVAGFIPAIHVFLTAQDVDAGKNACQMERSPSLRAKRSNPHLKAKAGLLRRERSSQ